MVELKELNVIKQSKAWLSFSYKQFHYFLRHKIKKWGAAAYQLGNTSSRTINEVKQH